MSFTAKRKLDVFMESCEIEQSYSKKLIDFGSADNFCSLLDHKSPLLSVSETIKSRILIYKGELKLGEVFTIRSQQ